MSAMSAMSAVRFGISEEALRAALVALRAGSTYGQQVAKLKGLSGAGWRLRFALRDLLGNAPYAALFAAKAKPASKPSKKVVSKSSTSSTTSTKVVKVKAAKVVKVKAAAVAKTFRTHEGTPIAPSKKVSSKKALKPAPKAVVVKAKSGNGAPLTPLTPMAAARALAKSAPKAVAPNMVTVGKVDVDLVAPLTVTGNNNEAGI
jgi:hypothetical protein